MSEKSDEEKKKIYELIRNTCIERYGESYASDFAKIGYKTAVTNGNYKSGFKIIQYTDHEKWVKMHKQAGQTMKTNIDSNGNNHYDRIHIKKLNDIDENGNNHYDRHYKMMIKNGKWIDPDKKEDYVQYYQKVWRLTNRQNISILENFKLRGMANQGKYHLDHKFSINEGFKQNIPIHIIGNIENLQMITGRNNLSKGKKCSITIDNLLKNINKNVRTSNDYPERE